jgi:hypothetical protein
MKSKKMHTRLMKKISELTKRNESLEQSIDFRNKKDYENGEHLKGSPFIPEYLGFTETVHREGTSSVKARIYTKNGYNIAKSVSTNRNEWAVLDPRGKQNSVSFSSMYNGIIVLRACGMEISIYDYNVESQKMIEEIDAKIQQQFEESKRLEED